MDNIVNERIDARKVAAADMRDWRNSLAGLPRKNAAVRSIVKNVPAKPTAANLLVEFMELTDAIAYREAHRICYGHMMWCGEQDGYMEVTNGLREKLQAVAAAMVEVRETELVRIWNGRNKHTGF